MNAPTPTPRTDAATYPADCLGKTLVTNRDLARALETELAALTAERDQLHAEVERLSALGSWAHTCIHHNDQQRAACPVCLVTTLTAERDQLRADNSTLRAAQKACEACDEPTAFEVRQVRARAERAEADAAAYLKRAESFSKLADEAEAELAAERARLDYLLRWHPTFNSREDIDRDMNGGAK